MPFDLQEIRRYEDPECTLGAVPLDRRKRPARTRDAHVDEMHRCSCRTDRPLDVNQAVVADRSHESGRVRFRLEQIVLTNVPPMNGEAPGHGRKPARDHGEGGTRPCPVRMDVVRAKLLYAPGKPEAFEEDRGILRQNRRTATMPQLEQQLERL